VLERTFDRVLRSLDCDPSARGTLVTLASASGATFTSDLALILDDPTLVLLLRHLFAEREVLLAAAPTLENVRWSLERTSWRFVAAAMMEEVVAPEIEGAVLGHAGAVARFPAMLEDAVLACGDQSAFAQRLVDEKPPLPRRQHRVRPRGGRSTGSRNAARPRPASIRWPPPFSGRPRSSARRAAVSDTLR
jgi:hypothetical protein